MLDAFAIFSAVRDGSGRIVDLRYEYINEAGCKDNRMTNQELTGKTLLEVLPRHKESGLFDEYCQVIETGVPLKKESLEYEDIWGGHRLSRTFDSQVTKLGDGLAIAWRDITARKHLEAQLRQSQKMETAGRLAGGVAHDFNNLLTAIMGYGELLAGSLDDQDPLRKHVDQIMKAGERAASLTRQLLAFSRKQVLQPKVFDLNNVIADVEKILRRLIGEDIELLTPSAPKLGAVMADPGQIEQVLLNLAVNARDAMPHGGKLIVETTNMVIDEEYVREHGLSIPPGPYVMLSVSDTGCGMDKNTQTHIFEPFFTTKELGKGTGLGLSIVYGIVSQSGGGICVHSTPGAGSTFEVYLPQVLSPVADTEEKVQTTAAFIAEETILLVEDEEIVRKLVSNILQMRGYTVLEASNGDEALRVCERYTGAIHLMLTDVVMPRMSGRELAERLAQLRPEVKVLFMSGYTDDAILRLGISREGLNFIQKPFTPDALARRVRELLNASSGDTGSKSVAELSRPVSLDARHRPAGAARSENESLETIH
jgi:signal transduction histidine kinase/CheY-like chemotaxis protein